MKLKALLSPVLCLFFSVPAAAAGWSVTELQYQKGTLEQVGTDGAEYDANILTLQHVHGWDYGKNFFFIDYVDANSDHAGHNPFNPGEDSQSLYGEWYSTFSLSKLTQHSFKFGFINDIGIVLGLNVSEAVDSLWFLPGVALELDLPGFKFANLAFTGYMNHSYADSQDTEFKVLDEGDSYMIDFSWDYPFKIGQTSWSITGHAEYIDGRSQRSTIGQKQLSYWILAQPQIRLDVGELLFNQKDRLYAGIEYQYWLNKLGEKGTIDNEAQLLAVWRF